MIFKFDQQYRFPITDDEILRCIAFAQSSTNDYSKRNQDDQENIQRQLVFGKVGELVAAKFIVKGLKYPAMEPDFRIFEKGDKSWDADFPYKTLGTAARNIHIKSYAPSDKPESWAFQYQNKNGNGGTDKLFSEFKTHRKDLIVCILVDIPNRVGTIRVVGDWNDIHGCLSEPVSPKLQGLKKFLYYDLLDEDVLTKTA